MREHELIIEALIRRSADETAERCGKGPPISLAILGTDDEGGAHSQFLTGAGMDVFWLRGWGGFVPRHNGGVRIVKSTR
jgi:hypothetical protein